MPFFNPATFPIGAVVHYKAARMDIDVNYSGDSLIEWRGVVEGECDLDHRGRAISVPLTVKRIGKPDAIYQVPMEDILAVDI